MNPEALHQLLAPSGQEVLAEAMSRSPRREDFLRHFTALSRKYPAELARSALETAILRREAVRKFPQAQKMYFTREALEQATGADVAAYRAERYQPFRYAIDLGCSIGGDTLALAHHRLTLGVDLDPLRLLLAKANAQALGLVDQTGFVQADLYAWLPARASADTALFFDPARRSHDKRAFHVWDYQPPLEVVNRWRANFPALGVKISPGVDLQELQHYDAEVEFISSAGELKEAVLWFGPLKTATRRATLLPGPYTLIAEAPGAVEKIPLSEPLRYIYEPDPAILRAGLVRPLGRQLNAAQLDEDIAYLTAAQYQPTPFARAWEVETWLPFNLKHLRDILRQRKVGRVTVKKRGSPLEPQALVRDLRLKGEQERVIFLTHFLGKPIVILAAAGPLGK